MFTTNTLKLLLLLFLLSINAKSEDKPSRQTNHVETESLHTPSASPRPVLRPEENFTAPKGSFEVLVDSSLTLKDSKRDREIPLRIYYPVGKEKSPLILFSHGWSESNASYEYLARYWASHGYTVILPTHLGIDRSTAGFVLFWPKKIVEDTKNPDRSKNSPLDVKFVIDSLSQIQEKVPALKGRISAEQMAMAGHSWGSYASMLLAGAKPAILTKEEAEMLKEPRFKAFLNISPQGSNITGGFSAPSWKTVEAPMLMLRGAEDKEVPPWNKPAKWRDEAFENLSSKGGDKFKVVMEGPFSTHMAFTGHNLIEEIPVNKVFLQKVQAVTLAYWKSVFEGKNFEEDPALKQLIELKAVTEEKKVK